MAQEEMYEPVVSQGLSGHEQHLLSPSQQDVPSVPLLQPPSSAQQAPCSTCAGGAASLPVAYVYALGQLEARFPRVSVEKEVTQALGRTDMTGKTDRQAFHAMLSRRENRYLARQLCWVMTIQGIETYILQPRDLADLDLLIETTNPPPTPWSNLVIGIRGPLAPPELCNGLMAPLVAFDQIYTFDHASLVKAIPRPEKLSAQEFESAAQEVFERILQLTDNAGSTDEHRALNYLAVRYPAIYVQTAEQYGQNASLTTVEVRPSRLSGVRKIVDVIFSYTNRQTDVVEKCFARVDVTEEFPFLLTKLSPYYDR